MGHGVKVHFRDRHSQFPEFNTGSTPPDIYPGVPRSLEGQYIQISYYPFHSASRQESCPLASLRLSCRKCVDIAYSAPKLGYSSCFSLRNIRPAICTLLEFSCSLSLWHCCPMPDKFHIHWHVNDHSVGRIKGNRNVLFVAGKAERQSLAEHTRPVSRPGAVASNHPCLPCTECLVSCSYTWAYHSTHPGHPGQSAPNKANIN